MRRKGDWVYPNQAETRKIFAPGCHIDWDNNIVYGADGKVYRDVRICREDLDRLIKEELARRARK
jgi:hypothetical protein